MREIKDFERGGAAGNIPLLQDHLVGADLLFTASFKDTADTQKGTDCQQTKCCAALVLVLLLWFPDVFQLWFPDVFSSSGFRTCLPALVSGHVFQLW
jgi:hypothetical protein